MNARRNQPERQQGGGQDRFRFTDRTQQQSRSQRSAAGAPHGCQIHGGRFFRPGGICRGHDGSGENKRQRQQQVGRQQIDRLHRLHRQSKIIQRHPVQCGKGRQGAQAEGHKKKTQTFCGRQSFFPALLASIEDIQAGSADGKSKQRDADDHERQVIPLIDGKNPREQNLEGQGAEGENEHRRVKHDGIGGVQSAAIRVCGAHRRSWARRVRR